MSNHNLLAFLIGYSRKEIARKNKSLQTLEEYCNRDVKANKHFAVHPTVLWSRVCGDAGGRKGRMSVLRHSIKSHSL